MKSTPKLKLLKRCLSQPWAGPAIGLIVLGVSITSLIYNKAGYDRQTRRWQAEENNQIQLQLHIEGGLTADGYRPAFIQLYFRSDDPLRLERLEATAPDGITIRADDPKIVKPGTATRTSFEIDESVGSTTQGASLITVYMSLRTRQTPQDQNTVIQIKGNIVQLSGQRQHLQRQTQASIPSDAKR
jgi:hypothetical protein